MSQIYHARFELDGSGGITRLSEDALDAPGELQLEAGAAIGPGAVAYREVLEAAGEGVRIEEPVSFPEARDLVQALVEHPSPGDGAAPVYLRDEVVSRPQSAS